MSKHPTDDIPLPGFVVDLRSPTVFRTVSNDQLRAMLIKAYDMGLKDVQHICTKFAEGEKEDYVTACDDINAEIDILKLRSMKS